MYDMQWNDIEQLAALNDTDRQQAGDRFERAHLTPDRAATYLRAGYDIHETIDLGAAGVPLDFALMWRDRGASTSAAVVAWEMQLHAIAA